MRLFARSIGPGSKVLGVAVAVTGFVLSWHVHRLARVEVDLASLIVGSGTYLCGVALAWMAALEASLERQSADERGDIAAIRDTLLVRLQERRVVRRW